MTSPMRLPRPAAISVLMVVVLLLGLAGPAWSDQAGGDPLRAQQWHLDAVSAAGAWEHSRGDGITVAVVDTGVDADHPDLAGQVLAGYNATAPGTPADDDNGHGTLVAGVVAAVAGNGEGGVGVAPHASILPVRVLDGAGRGEPDQVADGIRWAAERGADVINLSFVEVPGAANELLDGLGLIDRQVEQAIRDAHAAGSVVIAAAGNEGVDDVPYADDLPVTVVGASDRAGRRWHRSNADADTLFAPGVDIASTWSAERYAEASGTSFAAPIVAAGAAMLLDVGVDHDDVVPRLRRHARPMPHSNGVDVVDLAGTLEGQGEATGSSEASQDSDRTQEAASDDAPEPATPDDDAAAAEGRDTDGRGERADDRETTERDGSRQSAPSDGATLGQRPSPGGEEGPGESGNAGDGAEGDEVASGDQLTVGDHGGGLPVGPVVIAWTLFGAVVTGHLVFSRRLFD